MTGESDEVRETAGDNDGEDRPIVPGGWSIKASEMRRVLRDVPDDYEIVLDCADVEDCEIAEVHVERLYPPALGAPGLAILGSGQTISSEYGYPERMDAHHIVGGYKHWDSHKRVWKQK